MSLIQESKMIADAFKANMGQLEHNNALYDIFEGNLEPYVLAQIKRQVSKQVYEQISHRVAPINVLRKIIDKQSGLYLKPPQRMVVDGNTTDIEVFGWYEKQMRPNLFMGVANGFFNLFKNFAIEPYLNRDLKPRLRTLPSDRFFVISTDTVEPNKPTHFVKIMGTKKINSEDQTVLYVYTDEEFLIMNSKGQILGDEMSSRGLDGSNPFGKIPFVYQVKSANALMPVMDTDMYRMTTLLPILLSDLNFAVMYQSFSIMYGIDVDSENLKMSPNSFWAFKSDPAKNTEPKIGMIKPEVDTDKVVSLIQTELAMWLQSKGIRPGAVGQLTTENFASGISKMVDEMDTSDDRQKQIPFFKEAEESLWDLILQNMHPVWMRNAGYDQKLSFSSRAKVEVVFREQLPNQNFQQVLTEVKEQMSLGLMNKEMALKKLYPDSSQEQIDELLSMLQPEEIEVETNGEEMKDEQLQDEENGEEDSDEEADEEEEVSGS
jgi:hypothetical protein